MCIYYHREYSRPLPPVKHSLLCNHSYQRTEMNNLPNQIS